MGPNPGTGNRDLPISPEMLKWMGPDMLSLISAMLRSNPVGAAQGFGELLPQSPADIGLEGLTALGLPPGASRIVGRALPSIESLLKKLPQASYRGSSARTALQKVVDDMDLFLMEHGDQMNPDQVYTYLKGAGLDKTDLLGIKYRYGKHAPPVGGDWNNSLGKSMAPPHLIQEQEDLTRVMMEAVNKLLSEM